MRTGDLPVPPDRISRNGTRECADRHQGIRRARSSGPDTAGPVAPTQGERAGAVLSRIISSGGNTSDCRGALPVTMSMLAAARRRTGW